MIHPVSCRWKEQLSIFVPALLGFLACSPFVHAQPDPDARPFVRSDANADGNLNLTDPLVTLMYLFLGENTPDCRDAADSNEIKYGEKIMHYLRCINPGYTPP